MPTRSTRSEYVNRVSQAIKKQMNGPISSPDICLSEWQINALQTLTLTEPLLISDDDRMARQYYNSLLNQKFGFQLIDTATAEQALHVCHTQPVSLVISCIMKPHGIDGLTLTEYLRTDAATRHLPLMIITASSHARAQALRSGANAFLTKPCHPNEILQSIWRLLRGRVL